MGQPLILPKWKFFNADGSVLTGGKLYSYQAGTSTPLATYTDTTEVTPNANPTILDANGEAVVWLGTSSYKFVLKDSLDNVLWTADGVQTIPNGSITTIKLADGSVTTAKIADGAITTVKILDQNVTTAKIADNAITLAKIPDGLITPAKLSASTEIAFVETSAPRYGSGPSALPVKPWSSPSVLAVPATPIVGDGLGVAWSPNGKVLAVAENHTDFIALYERKGSELVKLSPGLIGATSQVGVSASWSPSGKYLAALGGTSVQFFQRYGNCYASLFPPFTGARLCGAWCPNELYYAATSSVSPYVAIAKRGDTLGSNIIAKYTSTAGQSIPASSTTSLAFATRIVDNFSSYTPSGGAFGFTATRQNGYTVKAQVSFPNVAWAASNRIILSVAVNGTFSQILDSKRIDANWAGVTTSDKVIVSGEAWLYLQANDVVTVTIFQNTAGAQAIDTTAGYNMVSVTEDAGFEELSSFTLLAGTPGTAAAGASHAVAWSPDGLFLAVGHATTPFVTIYQRTGDTFAKCTDPASVPAGQVNGLSWSPDGLTLTCVHTTSPYISSFYRSSVSSTSFTKISTNPATLPAGTGNACAYNSSGSKLAVAHDTSPYVTIYSVSGTGNSKTFTKDADPSSLPTGNGKAVSWTADGNYLAVGHTSSPYVTNYKTSGTYGSSAVTYVNEVDLV
jgi:hypothetical protein